MVKDAVSCVAAASLEIAAAAKVGEITYGLKP